MLGEVSGGALGTAALWAYCVRGRSASAFGPSVYHGPRPGRAIALTFDDGPSESTPRLLDILASHRVPATFFQCGANIRRLSSVAREVAAAGHEIGNHSDSHPLLAFKTAAFIEAEFARAQRTIGEIMNRAPTLMRPPFGVRWFGFRRMQRRLGLLGVMWTVLARDYKLAPDAIVRRVMRLVSTGAIVCLHDGRELRDNPDIEATIEAVRRLIPELAARGYEFVTVTQLLCPTN